MNIVRTLAMMRGVHVIEESKNIDDILQRKPAGVLIATPSATHAEIALPFIGAGVPTFIEKPMATTVDDAVRIYDAVSDSGVPVIVGHLHLHNPAFRMARKLLPEVGPVEALFWEGMNNSPRTDSSVLWDWLPHALSMAQVLLDSEPGSAQAWGVGEPVRFRATIAKFMIAGIPLFANASWMSPVKRHRLTIVGTHKSLVFDDNVDRKLSLFNPLVTSFPEYGEELPLTSELRAFIDLLSTDRLDAATNIGNEVTTVRAIAAAEESARSGGPLVTIGAWRPSPPAAPGW